MIINPAVGEVEQNANVTMIARSGRA